jgi:hypothetical protein
MKFTRWIPFSILACIALFIGQWTGRNILRLAGHYSPEQVSLAAAVQTSQLSKAESGEHADYPTPTSAQPLPPIPDRHRSDPAQKINDPVQANRQENILFIGVNNLTAAHPRMLSAWLIIYLNDKSHFMLLPLYPTQTPAAVTVQPEDTLANQFAIGPDGGLSENFIQALQEREIWWTGYVIMDQKAIASLLDYASGKNYIRGADMLDNLPDPDQDSMSALLEQARLARSLCLSTGQLTRDGLWQVSKFYSTIQEHVSTDIDVESALMDWDLKLKRGGITCEFPSLATALLLP